MSEAASSGGVRDGRSGDAASHPAEGAGWPALLGLAVASACTLALELLDLRLLSYAADPSLVFAAVGVALLGGGAGSVLVALRPQLSAGELRGTLSATLAAFALLSLGGHAVLFSTVEHASGQPLVFVPLLAILALSFGATGLASAVVLTRGAASPVRPYVAMVLGSAAGAILPGFVLHAFGGERAVALVALLGAAAAVGLGWAASRRVRAVALAALCASGAGALVAGRVLPLPPDPADLLARALAASGRSRPPAGALPWRVHDAWDPVGRIEVWSFPGAFGRIDGAPFRLFVQDAGAGSMLVPWLREPVLRQALCETTVYGAGYVVRPAPSRVLVIGLGGAPDVACAVHHGARSVTAVELSGAVLDALAGSQARFLGDPLRHRAVVALHEDGRAFLERTRERFDLVQMSGTDTYSAAASGAFVFSESYLYTEEAFDRAWSRLSSRGVLAIVRFGLEPVRILATAVRALRRAGVARPERHLAILRQGIWVSVVVSRVALDRAAASRLAGAMLASHARPSPLSMPLYEALGFGLRDPLVLEWVPGLASRGVYPELLGAVRRGAEERAFSRLALDFSPIRDDRPFFFQHVDASRLGLLFDASADPYYVAGLRHHLLFLAGAFLLASCLVVAPALALRRRGLARRRAPSVALCFGALGAAYLLVELALLSKTGLVLGHPAYGATLTISTLLASSGLGSVVAARAVARRPLGTVLLVTLVLAVTLAAFEPMVVPWLRAALAWPFALRVALLVAAVAPVGALMGVPFPAALAAVAPDGRASVAWALGVNGFASVVASLAAIPCAMLAGFSSLLLAGAALYVVAAVALVRHRRA